MRVIIAGSRLGVYQEFFEQKLKELFLLPDSPYEITEVVSGCQKGVDTMGIDWAFRHGFNVQRFEVTNEDWAKLGNSAGPIRNGQMAEYGDLLVAFFNENALNRGTKNMCKQMVARGKKVIRLHEKLCRAKSLISPFPNQ